MPGKKSSKEQQPNQVIYLYDESLPEKFVAALIAAGFLIVPPVKGQKDEKLIPDMGKAGHTWLTKDHRARAEHEPLLLQEKISVVWVRGLTHSKKKKGPIQKNVSLKDVLRLLVNKLDEITETIANANGPRYFLLYMTHAKKSTVGSFATLKEVWQRLAK